MRTPLSPSFRRLSGWLAVGLLLVTTAQAANLVLTGHDVLLHGGQNGFDAVILNYLRGGEPNAAYDVGVVGSANAGGASFSGGLNITGGPAYHAIPLTGALLGYRSATFYDAQTLANDSARAALLGALDLLIIESHVSAGGGSLSTAGSAALNAMAPDIHTAFNAGLDLWVQAGAGLASYYGFLPAGMVTPLPMTGSEGFAATSAGLAIGIRDAMTNGFQTHNHFAQPAVDFTVLETHLIGSGPAMAVTIGIKDAAFLANGVAASVPDSGATLLLLALTLPCCGAARRRPRGAGSRDGRRASS